MTAAGALPVAATGDAAGGFDVGLPGVGHLPAAAGLHRSSSRRPSPRPSAPRSTCPRARREIIGYFVEYSGMKFGMFMISEFVEVVVLVGRRRPRSSSAATTCPSASEWRGAAPICREHRAGCAARCWATLFWMKVCCCAGCSCHPLDVPPLPLRPDPDARLEDPAAGWAWRTCSSPARWSCGIRAARRWRSSGMLEIGVLRGLTLSAERRPAAQARARPTPRAGARPRVPAGTGAAATAAPRH